MSACKIAVFSWIYLIHLRGGDSSSLLGKHGARGLRRLPNVPNCLSSNRDDVFIFSTNPFRLMAHEISSDREWNRIYLAVIPRRHGSPGERLVAAACRFIHVERFYILDA